MSKLTMCPDCNHVSGWMTRVRGCSTTINSGPCNSDYEYCGCKNASHNVGRCAHVTVTTHRSSDGETTVTESRCIDTVFHNAAKCESHLTSLQRAKGAYEHLQSMERYHEAEEERRLASSINTAIALLETNGYTVTIKEAHRE